MSCYYKILGISERASEEEIKRSFRLLAMRWHPDRNRKDPRAAERFREALEAYETLSDPLRRDQYDRSRGYGKTGRGSHARKRSTRFGPMSRGTFEDVLQEAFGIRVERSPENGRGVYDLRFDLQITHSAIMEGTFEQIEYVKAVFCPGCTGVGRTGSNGSRNLCEECSGVGEIEERCSIRVWIPPGAEEGARLRVPGAGDRLSPAGPAGDLVILLYVVEGG